jgi:PAS domain S-box-containing protein
MTTSHLAGVLPSRTGFAPVAAEALEKDLEGIHVLLVDDQPDKALAIRSVVEELGHTLTVATSGEAGLRELLSRHFALVLLDVHMPGMDGFEMAQLIRSRPAYENLAIIFISSADLSEERLDRAYALGAVDFVAMPARRSVLKAKISAIVRLQSELRGREAAPVETPSPALPPHERWQLLLDNARDLAVFFLDNSGVVVEWSPGAETSFGWTAPQIIGQPVSVLFTAGDVAAQVPQTSLGRALAGDAQVEERWYQHRDGSRFWGYTRMVALKADGHHGFGVILRNMNDRKLAADDLERRVSERTAQLQEVVGELEAFSYSISHDLQAPLRAISTYSEIVATEYDHVLPEEGLDYIRRISDSAARLQTFIQDVLNYCRVPRDQISLVPIDVAQVVREIVESTPALQPPRVCILVQEPLHRILGHAPLVTQIFSNLLGNAAKFVAPGQTPVIVVRSEKVDGDVVLWVEDNGVGIKNADRERIFDMFERAHPQLSLKGTGIGLAIVRKAVERLGGSVGVESKFGAGSRFWIRLRASLSD